MIRTLKFRVILSVLFVALLCAVGNNLLNHRSIDWLGSPEVLQKPAGWPAGDGLWKGVQSGIATAGSNFLKTKSWVLGIALGTFFLTLGLNKLKNIPCAIPVAAVLRLGLGIMFVTAAWPKWHDPKSFSSLVANYQFLPAFSVNGFSLYLPMLEMVVGLGIVFTAWKKEFTLLLGILFVMFIVALAQALGRDLGIACGCFDIEGATNPGETWFSLLRDIVLLVPTAWLYFYGHEGTIWSLPTKSISVKN